MYERKIVEIKIDDIFLENAIKTFIENINTLTHPLVEAAKHKSAWRKVWSDGSTMPDGFSFLGDNEPRKAWLQATAIYNDEQHVGKITIDVVESNLNSYPPETPLLRRSALVDVIFATEIEVVVAHAKDMFGEQVKVYCKRKNDEAQS